jgi:hypothetical protein
MIPDGHHHPADPDKITEGFHVRQPNRLAVPLSAHARGRSLRRPLHFARWRSTALHGTGPRYSKLGGLVVYRLDYGTHSLRRTKASIIYKQTGNLRAVQILLGHTKIESTVRHLGVDVEDALALAESTEV